MSVVELANPQDAKRIYELVETEAKAGNLLPRSLKELTALIKQHRVYVIRGEGGKVLACATLELPRHYELRSLVVARGLRKNGLARKMVRGILVEAKEQGLLEVMAVTNEVRLFGALGFVYTPRSQRSVMFWHPKREKRKGGKVR